MISIKEIFEGLMLAILNPDFVHGESVNTGNQQGKEKVFSGGRTFSEVMMDNAKEPKQ
ncbi:hypothetical protein [Citrobacter sp. Marseille-Q6884]|uniref:hypothetical protein n=1 Tax=Citrobacter sp. Marseille-Q6884 TaxID=2956786 RepID=UPI0021B25DCB|nr:hypothetical protein [Citrobacter sp. Marseille-Q6884]